MRKIERDQLSAQLRSVEDILSSMPEHDYLGRMSFEARKEELEQQLRGLEAEVVMGWGLDGIEARDATKVALGLVRREFYKLTQTANTIKHSEKRPEVLQILAEIEVGFNRLEKLLNR